MRQEMILSKQVRPVFAISAALKSISEVRKKVRPAFAKVMRRSGLGQGENGIISSLNMSGEMHMRRRNEVFGCIPHGRGALTR